MKTLREFELKKAVQAINYFAHCPEGKVSKLRLIKLLYLVDRYHMRRYGRPVTNDIYFAMPLGPVGQTVKDIAENSDFLSDEEKEYSSCYIHPIENTHDVASHKEVDFNVFSESEIEALEFVKKNFVPLRTRDIVDLTHEFSEWKRHKSLLDSGTTSRVPMSYNDFFDDEKAFTGDVFASSKENLSSLQELYQETLEVADHWR